MSFEEADILQYCLSEQTFTISANVYERTCDAVINYTGDREQVIFFLQKFSFKNANAPEYVIQNSGREVNREYFDKISGLVGRRILKKVFLPVPLRTAITVTKSFKYIYKGFVSLKNHKIEVSVLDATAILVSLLRGDYNTASSVMFLLRIGELLEEWTHKKSVNDLARSMSLNVARVWQLVGEQEILTDAKDIVPDDVIVVHVGNVIPFDGLVVGGAGTVNQSSMTGESIPVPKEEGGYVYAGTVLEEGELKIKVKATMGSNRYEKIAAMIEETEKLKSSTEAQAEHLADRLVPYTLIGTGLIYLFTRNATKALAVLMVDYSCALKLAMPIAVLSAIREAGNHKITVKGGKFLEAVAAADTIVFDKTGTLTNARPVVKEIVTFNKENPDELLRLAACLEEHFPHSMAKAVVDAALEKGLTHEEKHSSVKYIVAHGISSTVDGKNVIIGSKHFVFEDEHAVIPKGTEEKFDGLREEYSHLFLAIDGVLAAAISISDPLRDEAVKTISELRKAGFKKIVMMTGDSEKTARAIAKRIGADEFYAEVLPEDKAKFIEKEKSLGKKVIMVGDGINDSPALSAADVGIAINDGAQIAREIADITIDAGNLNEIVILKYLSLGLMKRIKDNYRKIITINSALILLGVTGTIMPTASALIHNMSTLMIGLKSMEDIL